MRRKDIIVGRLHNTSAGLADCLTVEPELTFRVLSAIPRLHPVTLTPRQVETCIPEKDREKVLRLWSIYSDGGCGGHTHGR